MGQQDDPVGIEKAIDSSLPLFDGINPVFFMLEFLLVARRSMVGNVFDNTGQPALQILR